MQKKGRGKEEKEGSALKEKDREGTLCKKPKLLPISTIHGSEWESARGKVCSWDWGPLPKPEACIPAVVNWRETIDGIQPIVTGYFCSGNL